MKVYKKLIILVMSSTSKQEYLELEQSIKDTWYNLKTEEVEIIFYKDNQNLQEKQNYPVFNGFDLVLPIEDGFYTLNQKTLMAFEWVCQNYEFDYIYRSNLGAFVDIKNMISFLNDKPKEKFYCGIFGFDEFYFGRPMKFVSGSGYFLSKDLVFLCLQNLHQWPWRVVDDVALGYILIELNGIEPSKEGLRKDICDDTICYVKGDKFVEYLNDDLIYHYRIRSDNRKQDIAKMKEIYKKITTV